MKKLLSLVGLVGIPMLAVPNVIAYSQNQVKINEQVNNNLDQINDTNYIEKTILASENRPFQHSYLTPTGYFLEKDKEYLIRINKNVKSTDLLYLSIGQYGVYKNLNDGKDSGFETYQIIGDNLIITPKISGMLYLKDYRFTNSVAILSITNNEPIKVPTFIVDETNQTEFFNQVLTTKSFFVEIVSKHIFGTFQTEMFKSQVINVVGININDTVLAWDQIWKYSNEVYGLNEKYSGVAKKYQQFIQISNPDSGPGYASSTNYRITFQNKTNAGRDLFTKKPNNQWGLWHEIGHSYQTPQYNWTNLTEVTVNISALYVQKFIAGTNNVDSASNIKIVKAFLDSNDVNKDFNTLQDLFAKLTMFWQLQMAFGDNFYPTISQLYRTDYLIVPNMQQDFVKITSKVANRNLIPFFEKWGFSITDDTKKAIEQLPSLKNNIWENVINGTHQSLVEWQVPKYQLSILKYEIKQKKTIDFGTIINETNLSDNFDILNNKNILKNQISFDWMNFYFKDNKYYVPMKITVKDDDLLSNNYLYFVQVSFEDTISLIGYAYYQRGIIGLDKENHKFYFTGSRIGLDVTQKPNTYYTIIIKNQNGTIVKQIALTGADNVDNIIKQNDLLNISYQEGYTLEIKTLITNKNRLFSPVSNTWVTNNTYDTEYQISNNKLIKVS